VFLNFHNFLPFVHLPFPYHLLVMVGSKLTQKVVNEWLESAWRDGYRKGVDGRDEMPNFSELDPRGPDCVKGKVSPGDASVLPYDESKCCCRMFRGGYGVQCTRSPLDGREFCKIHQKKYDSLDDGLDVPFGRYNGDRPTHSLDKVDGDKIGWADLRGSTVRNSKKRAPAKEMRDKLTELGVSIEGLKGRNLTDRYNEVMDQENSPSSSLDESDSQADPVEEESVEEPVEEESVEEPVEEDSVEVPVDLAVEMPEDLEEPFEDDSVEDSVEDSAEEKVEDSVEEMVEEKTEDSVEEKTEEEVSVTSDDGKGTGLNLIPHYPENVSDYKKLFSELDISIEGLKGKPAYKARYEKYLAEKASDTGEDTEDLSDEDNLTDDEKNFDKIDYEGVEYLEDEDTGNIYSTSHKLMGKWDDDCTDILWIDESARLSHESNTD